MDNGENSYDIERRTYRFGIEVIKLINKLPKTTACFVIGKQVIASGTSINSNIIHAQSSLSKKEFTYFMNNAKKEAKETKNWLTMLVDSEIIKAEEVNDILNENEEIIKILVSSVKTCQLEQDNQNS